MSEPTLYLFDGSNLFHAGGYAERETLIDALASFVATHAAQGVVVFDGTGTDREIGPLAVRFASDADALLERLAAERRGEESVLIVTSDQAIRVTSGQEVRTTASAVFLAELAAPRHQETPASRVADRLDEETRARMERLRRGG
ncbi:MAG: NYN domain-containing protein [Gaiella sp.]